MLAGKTHAVYTGVSLVLLGASGRVGELTFHERTDVVMRAMTEQEILRYIQTGEPFDKPGSYAIQGKCAIYIDKINETVVGLPVRGDLPGVKRSLESTFIYGRIKRKSQGGSCMYDKMCLEAFLAQQGKLFSEPVAETLEEAEEFLEDCMAVIVKNSREIPRIFRGNGCGYCRNERGRTEKVVGGVCAFRRQIFDRRGIERQTDGNKKL